VTREIRQEIHPSGAKARVILLALLARLNRLRKKSERKANPAEDGSAGAKAQHILLALSARLKPCPDTRLLRLSFSASCEVVPFQNRCGSEFFRELFGRAANGSEYATALAGEGCFES
jgi:hypothetical protein